MNMMVVMVMVMVMGRHHGFLKWLHTGERAQRRPGKQIESSSWPSATEPVHKRT
jgi:hypothetical protein